MPKKTNKSKRRELKRILNEVDRVVPGLGKAISKQVKSASNPTARAMELLIEASQMYWKIYVKRFDNSKAKG